MKTLKPLLDKNAAWANAQVEQDPEFFKRLENVQKPKYLWIGCSDSRIPANEVLGLAPGEVFVHRNVANQVIHTDFNVLTVLQYAIDVLKVEHIIICGHYGCGGIKAAIDKPDLGLAENWLQHIRDVYDTHAEELDQLKPDAVETRLGELNVKHQVKNVANTTIVQRAWERDQPLYIHGWIYALSDGLLRDLDCCIENQDELANFKI
tara:strand:+ start:251778 stop:252398 length:621 start_codon:yes stop_codon:yes gene_type:complete